ncbi:MAG: dUTP diphosphatase [Acidimicrobiia bacterium]
MKIPLKRIDDGLPIPAHAHPGDGGVDLYARDAAELAPGEREVVATGIAVAIPDGYAGFVTPRSGLAARHGISVVNGPGLVDAGYRGEIKVILVNLSQEVFVIERGDRIAQLVVVPIVVQEFVGVDELPVTTRGSGGFGSTGS